jgi:hypothetical protein
MLIVIAEIQRHHNIFKEILFSLPSSFYHLLVIDVTDIADKF